MDTTEDILEAASFSLKNFFQRFLENFLYVLRLCSIYIKGHSNIVFYIREKIVVMRQIDDDIMQKYAKILKSIYRNIGFVGLQGMLRRTRD